MFAFDAKQCRPEARCSVPRPASQHPLQRVASDHPLASGRVALVPHVQRKPILSTPGDACEREADLVADRVMRQSAAVSGNAPVAGEGECAKCRNDEKAVSTKHSPGGGAEPTLDVGTALAAVNGGGRPLPETTREFFEARLGHDFSRVRVHADDQAASAARSLGAAAYTIGRDIAFGANQYQPGTDAGRRLLAHELTHVVQQSANADRAASPRGPELVRERTGAAFIGRQNTRETAAVLRTGTVAGSGVQFWPLQVTSTQIGPTSGQGGLLADARNRLSVIVGQAMTLRRIAALILPLWNSAAPFTPSGATTPLVTPPITTDDLARGLLVYNRYYLRVLSAPAPSMTGWTGGLRFPLPAEIDSAGVATVNKDLILSLASGFDAAWEPLLDQPASAGAAPTAANTSQAASDFLAAHADADARGIALATSAITNAVEARPLVVEVFNQLGAGRFDVALAFMDSSVNSQISLLASQRDGAAILAAIRGALAAAPAQLSAKQQESLTRANLMLGLVATVTPRAPNFAQPSAVSPAGLHMIADFEGFCPNLYDDAMPGCGRGRGNCTIGFGHLVHSGPCNGTDASEAPFLGGLTRAQGETLFANELTGFVNHVRTTITVPLSQAQFDALVSFDFNTGRLNALSGAINANNFAAVPGIMNQFVNARVSGVMVRLGGLVTRRAAEGTLFSTGTYPP